jgi:hypothetical protein
LHYLITAREIDELMNRHAERGRRGNMSIKPIRRQARRDHALTFAVSSDQAQRLVHAARSRGATLSEIMHSLIDRLPAPAVPVPDAELPTAMRTEWPHATRTVEIGGARILMRMEGRFFGVLERHSPNAVTEAELLREVWPERASRRLPRGYARTLAHRIAGAGAPQ